MKDIEYSILVQFRGRMPAVSADPEQLLGAILPNGWNGKVIRVTTDPAELPYGFIIEHDEKE